MTREQFLDGVSFCLPNELFIKEDTYRYNNQMILKEERTLDGRNLFSVYEANVSKVGRVGFEAFTFVLGKKIKVKYRFEDLKEYKGDK